MGVVLDVQPVVVSDVRQVRLTPEKIEAVHARVQADFPARLRDWRDRSEHLERDRTYHLPRIRDIYSRADIAPEQRQALHATRDVIQALTLKSFRGSQGIVAEWCSIFAAGGIDPEVERAVPQSTRERSLRTCVALLRANSYDISEGVRFVRTPLVLPLLERKYYVQDLQLF